MFAWILGIFIPLAGISQQDPISLSDDFQIIPLTEHVYIHKSWVTRKPFGRFSSNGMIFVVDKSCLVFDTPMDSNHTRELILWLETEMEWSIKGVVANHFHGDCLAGLDQFHARGIPSYANTRTLPLAAKDSVSVPKIGFQKKMVIRMGEYQVVNYYPGPAHAPDNIVSYIPADKVLFGGCMVKSLRSGRGNLSDADLEKWSRTIEKVKRRFKKAEWVIPGHGKAGNQELLDYTIRMFDPKLED